MSAQQAPVPVVLYDKTIAEIAWSEVADIDREIARLRDLRALAHRKFMAVFTAPVE